MKRIGIFYNPTLFENIIKLKERIEFLQKNKYNIYLLESQKRSGLQGIKYVKEFSKKNIDLLIVLGGDGTILLASKSVLKESIPLLGFNHGKLGFLSECKKQEFEPAFSEIQKGSFEIYERMVIECIFPSHSEKKYFALNDCVLYKGEYPKMITFKILIDDEYQFDIEADGIITSTPTGSTGYNISAGGSIIFPHTNVLLLTPINPHNQFVKPFIFSAEKKLSIQYTKGNEKIYAAIDGENVEKMHKNQEIHIKRSDYTSKFIKLPDKTFAKIIKEKFID
ncbi:MAG: NAD(+)/NADH kinase [Candidatus Celaenobacter antarcticus]|nr:NAD(+)/NADH kinase [Candidatus Celaenobacter antarcticus]MDP8315156.1 NAD(+)/NADH kinase [Candidatus Celaenobacter antarcticus]